MRRHHRTSWKPDKQSFGRNVQMVIGKPPSSTLTYGIIPTMPCPECGETFTFDGLTMSLDFQSNEPAQGIVEAIEAIVRLSAKGKCASCELPCYQTTIPHVAHPRG